VSYPLGRLFALSWLLLLVFPIVSVATSSRPQAFVAGGLAGGLTFCAVYAWAWLRPPRWRAGKAPLVGVIAVTALALALVLADGPTWGSTLIYCSVLAACAFEWRGALVLAVGYALLAAVLAVGDGLGLPFAFGTFLELSLIGVGAIGVFRLVGTNIELRHAREEIARLAVSEERLRFARDLHDLLGHSLSVIVLKAELASKLAGRDATRAGAEMADVERVARQALSEVREAVADYREASPAQELDGLGQVLRSAGIEPRIEQTAGPLPADLEAVLAWAVREAVTNVVRHSGARTCAVRLSRRSGQARLEIRDDGAGAPEPTAEGAGLRGLRERVEARGGSFEAGPAPAGQGFRLLVSLPGA